MTNRKEAAVRVALIGFAKIVLRNHAGKQRKKGK